MGSTGLTRRCRSVLAVVLTAALLAELSSELPSRHPLHSVVDQVNQRGPFVGVVMAWPTEAESLSSSGAFVPSSAVAAVDLYGRIFHIGRIRDVDVIYVMSGQRRLNAGITVQILLDVFDIWGIVHYGIAGSANDSMSFGDVSIPKFVAFTGSWKWTKTEKEKGESTELSFGAFNFPKEGKNLLSKVLFKPEEMYSVNKSMEEVFWLQVNPTWFQLAEQLKDLVLQQCVNETYCLPETPKVVCGLKASTADVFVDNAAYRTFLFKELEVSTVDEESAAVMMTAMSLGVPVAVFRGVSDLAGGEDKVSTSLSHLASKNALKVALEFIGAIGRERFSSFK